MAAEGISLLSMYNDDDEEEELEPQNQSEITAEPNNLPQNAGPDSNLYSIPSESPPRNLISPSPEIRSKRSPTPPPWHNSNGNSVSPMISRPPSERDDGKMNRRGSGLLIVDYGHDEAAMSPEAEEGEIGFSGDGVADMEIQASEGNLEEAAASGSDQLLTPNNQSEPPQPSDMHDQTMSEAGVANDSAIADPEIAQNEACDVVTEGDQNYDPLTSFLPSRVTAKCSIELQNKINLFLAYKKEGISFNAALRNRKDYRNPDFLQHAVSFHDIDQIGTCFSKDVFDPHGYDRSDYYDEIEADMKREMERKELERKRSPKVEFVSGGTQISVTGISAAVSSGLQSATVASDATKEPRQNKKSKWDKVDGDVKHPVLPSGNDKIVGHGVHASHLSAANAGAGYNAFAQQKRREAEEKKSGERKSDRRS